MKNKLWLFFFLAIPGILPAEEIKVGFTPITTFTDDRDVQQLNKNFTRLLEFGVVFSSRDVSVPAGVGRTTMTFTTPMKDTRYSAYVATAWLTTTRVLGKTATGYYVEYGTPAPTLSTMDTMAVR